MSTRVGDGPTSTPSYGRMIKHRHTASAGTTGSHRRIPSEDRVPSSSGNRNAGKVFLNTTLFAVFDRILQLNYQIWSFLAIYIYVWYFITWCFQWVMKGATTIPPFLEVGPQDWVPKGVGLVWITAKPMFPVDSLQSRLPQQATLSAQTPSQDLTQYHTHKLSKPCENT